VGFLLSKFMQENLNNRNFEKVSIEVLASNPRNGQMLIEAIHNLFDAQDCDSYRSDLTRLFEGFLDSKIIEEETDGNTRVGLFFGYNKILELLVNLENALAIIIPDGIHSIIISEPDKYLTLKK
jgi:hypothetical protein